MRQIKFRGVRVDNNEWVYGGYVRGESGNNYIFQGNDGPEIVEDDCCLVHHETVGQFTGLKDKNGVDIYEGDIVCSFKKEYEDKPSKNLVEFISGCFRLVCIGKNDIPLHNYSPHHLEIVGNIHDGKEVKS